MSPSSPTNPEKGSAQSSLSAFTGQFGDAYSKLAQASYQAALQGQKQMEGAYLHLAKTIHGIQADINKRYVEAYQEYCKTAQEAANKQGSQQELAEAYQNFVETARGLQEDGARQTNEAHAEYRAKVQEAVAGSEEVARENYLGYLRSIQQAWTGLDVKSLV